jgi:hypothetical protein
LRLALLGQLGSTVEAVDRQYPSVVAHQLVEPGCAGLPISVSRFRLMHIDHAPEGYRNLSPLSTASLARVANSVSTLPCHSSKICHL